MREEEDQLLTINEAVSYLGISRNTFFRLRRERKIAPVNDNPLLARQHNPLFSKADLDRLKGEAERIRRGDPPPAAS